MALFGRGQSPRPHIANPVVASGGPVPVHQIIAVVAGAPGRLRGFWAGSGRNRILAAHLAVAIVAPGGPVPVPRSAPVEIRAAAYQQGFWNAPGRNRPIAAHRAVAIVDPNGPVRVPRIVPVVYDQATLFRPAVLRRVLKAHLAPPVVTALPTAPVAVGRPAGRQALRRPLVGRTVPPARLAQPVVASGGPVRVPRIVPVVYDQATLLRPVVVRTVPRAHLAGPVLTPASPVPLSTTRPAPGLSVSRAQIGRLVGPRAHLAPPVVASGGPVRFPRIVPYVYDQATLLRPVTAPRMVPRPHLAIPLLAGPSATPVGPGLVVTQALRRPLIGRTTPWAHLPSPTADPNGSVRFPRIVPFVYDQAALLRPVMVRTVPVRPHLAPPTLSVPPPPLVVVRPAESQALRRPLVGRTVPRAHLAVPVVDPNGPVRIPRIVPFVYDQAVLLRPLQVRTVPRSHLAGPLVTVTSIPGQPGLTVARMGRRGGAHRLPWLQTLAPGVAPAGPVHTGLVVTQAIRRPLVGRITPDAHLAAPTLSTAPPVAAQGRPGGRQALRRPYVGRTTPDTHVAPPTLTVAPPVIPPNAPGLTVARMGRRGGAHLLPYLQTLAPQAPPGPLPTIGRSGLPDNQMRFRPAGRVYAAAPNLTPFVPAVVTRPTVVGQALRRAAVGRTVARAHLAPTNLTVLVVVNPVVTRAKVVSQILRRPLVGRTIIRVHLPPATLSAAPPVAVAGRPGGRQAMRRPLVGRSTPRPHLAPPTLSTPVPPVVTASITPVGDQWLRRPYQGRRVAQDAIVSPPNLTVDTGFGQLTNFLIGADGVPLVGVVVTARLQPGDSFRILGNTNDEVIAPLQAVSDASGFWTLQLIRQDVLTASPTWWEITEQIPPGPWHIWTVTIGAGTQTLRHALYLPPAR